MQHCPSVGGRFGGICPSFMWQCENTITQSQGRAWPVTLYLPWVNVNVYSLLYLSINPSIYPASSVSGWGHFSHKHPASACDCEADVFKWLSALVYGLYLFSSSRFSELGPRWESYGSISVMQLRGARAPGDSSQKLNHVLHRRMDARWQHCSAMLKPGLHKSWKSLDLWLCLVCQVLFEKLGRYLVAFWLFKVSSAPDITGVIQFDLTPLLLLV